MTRTLASVTVHTKALCVHVTTVMLRVSVTKEFLCKVNKCCAMYKRQHSRAACNLSTVLCYVEPSTLCCCV
jgi:hypothetical protein